MSPKIGTAAESRMPPPKTVVFDLGKVLIDFDYGIAAQKLADQGTLPAAEVRRFIDHSPLLCQFETGLLNPIQMFEEIRKQTGFRGEFEEFRKAFCDIFTPIEPMIQLQARLRERGIPTFIFSNTNELQVEHIRRRFPFFQHFDGYILSYQQGAMKPDRAVYAEVERVTGNRGPEILYLDDRQENAEAGIAQGWQVIHHQSPETTLPVFSKLGWRPE